MQGSRLIFVSRLVVGVFAALAAGPVSAQTADLVPLPAQSPDVAWPTQDWPVATPAPDVDAALLARIDPVFDLAKADVMGETRAIVVVKDGEIVYERYQDGIAADTRHVSWSVAKSLTATLVGRAVQLGLIESIDDPMPAAFEPDDPRRDISWRHWLQMLDGLDYAEYGVTELMENDVALMSFGPGRFDQLAYAREHFPLSFEPGTRWNYSTAGMHLVARALQSLLPGTCAAPGEDPALCRADPAVMVDWANAVLFDPLGIDAVIEFDAAGTFLGGSSAYMSARDYARFGLLVLRDGVWEDERLLPPGWVDLGRTNPQASDTNVYGAGFWPSPQESDNPEIRFTPPFDAFHAGGREGQIVWIVPSRDMVIVRLGLMPDLPENWNALFRFAQEIVATVD
ncbi:MAG: serine hydrolase [Pseudomonadota bacterium]